MLRSRLLSEPATVGMLRGGSVSWQQPPRDPNRKEAWDEGDIETAKHNERLLACIDGQSRTPPRQYSDLYETMALILNRKPTDADWDRGLPVLPSLALTGEATMTLVEELFRRYDAGEIAPDPNWPNRFPDFYSSEWK